MEHSLVWASLALGCAGWLCATGLAWSPAPSPRARDEAVTSHRASLSTTWLWMAVAIPLVIWAATLPTKPPFSPGQGWGRGFLMGGLGALAGSMAPLYIAARSTARPLSLRAAALAPLFAILPVAGIALMWMRPSIIDSLSGIAAGWLVVSFILLLAVSDETEGRSTPVARFATQVLQSAAFAVGLCAVAALGVYRDFIIAGTVRGTHPAIALGLATVVPFALLCSALLHEVLGTIAGGTKTSGGEPVLGALVSIALMLGLAFVFSTNILDEPHLITTVATGVATSLLIWWLVHQNSAATVKPDSGTDSSDFVGDKGEAVTSPVPLAVLIALSAFVLSYQVLQGFGVGLMMLALWPVVLLATRDARACVNRFYSLTPLVVFVVLLLVSRVFSMRWRADLRGALIADHYALFGLLLGVLLPAMLTTLLTNPAPARLTQIMRPSPLRFVLALAIALAAPGAMVVLWGTKGTIALCIGLAVAAIVPPQITSSPRDAATHSPYPQSIITCFFSLFVALALTQWIHHLLPLSEASRNERLRFLLWGAGALVVLLLASDYGERCITWLRRKQQPAAPAKGGALP